MLCKRKGHRQLIISINILLFSGKLEEVKATIAEKDVRNDCLDEVWNTFFGKLEEYVLYFELHTNWGSWYTVLRFSSYPVIDKMIHISIIIQNRSITIGTSFIKFVQYPMVKYFCHFVVFSRGWPLLCTRHTEDKPKYAAFYCHMARTSTPTTMTMATPLSSSQHFLVKHLHL